MSRRKQKGPKNAVEKSKRRSGEKSTMSRILDFLTFPFRYIGRKLSFSQRPPPTTPRPYTLTPTSVNNSVLEDVKDDSEPPPPLPPKPLKVTKVTRKGTYIVNPERPASAPIPKPRRSLKQLSMSPLPSSRVPQCVLLFLGRDGAGMTSTMSNLFNLNVPEEKHMHIRQISEKLTAPHKIELQLIDVPGLGKGQFIDQDAEIITGLQNHLKSSLSNQIPNVTLIFTRFDDNRFEGEASEFTKMLISLSHCKRGWTDSNLSNVLLVLTHSSNVLEEEEDIHQKMSRFQQSFHQIFPSYSPNIVPCVFLDTLKDPLNSKSNLIDGISSIAKSRKDSAISQNFLRYLHKQEEGVFINPSNNLVSIESLLPQSRREINQLLDLIQQGRPYKEDDFLEEVDEEDLELRPYRVEYFPHTQSQQSQLSPIPQAINRRLVPLASSLSASVTILPPNTKLLLADGTTELVVQSLNIGDKLLDKDLKSNVITDLRMVKISENTFEGKWVGRIYVEAHYSQSDPDSDADYESESQGRPIILQYKGKRVRQEEFGMEFKTLDPDESHLFFIIKVDKQDGTFITDGNVMYHEHAAPNFKGSRTKL